MCSVPWCFPESEGMPAQHGSQRDDDDDDDFNFSVCRRSYLGNVQDFKGMDEANNWRVNVVSAKNDFLS